MSQYIAIVEDEPALRENYSDALRRIGYEVRGFAKRAEATEAFQRQLPDLAILDIGLEDDIEGGFELCRTLRAMSERLPIIFLTARDSDFDTISGLRLGADDYLTKDISLAHLSARVTALLRRVEILTNATQPTSTIEQDALHMDTDLMLVRWKSTKIDLTVTEFWILHALSRRPGHVKNRDQLMEEAKIYVDGATVTSHIKRIRRKFEAIDLGFDSIESVYGIGYRWRSSES